MSFLLRSSSRFSYFYHHQTNLPPNLPLSRHKAHPPFISLRVHIKAYHHTLTCLTAESLPCKTPSFCTLQSTCQPCFPLNYSFSISYGLDTLLLFLSTHIDFPLDFILQDYYCCRLDGRSLYNTNTGCYHNGMVRAQVTNTALVMQAAIHRWPMWASMFVLAP